MWDLIVSVPDHCLSFYFEIDIPNFCICGTNKKEVEFVFNDLCIRRKQS